MPVAPEVAVVVPTRDRPATLARALASVRAQTLAPVDVVVVDDGSEPPARVDDPQVRVLRHDTPAGSAPARNAAIATLTAPLVAFLDDDDAWRPHALATLAAALDRAGPGAVAAGGGFALRSRAGRVHEYRPRLGPDTVLDLLARPVFAPSVVLARREALLAAGGFGEQLERCEDWALWLRLAELGELVSVEELLADRELEPDPERDLAALTRFEALVVEPALAQRSPGERRQVRRRRALARAGLLRDAGRRTAALRELGRAALNAGPRRPPGPGRRAASR